MTTLRDKALAIMRFVALPATSHERRRFYEAACARWSEKAIDRKCEELADRGYLEYGVSARTGWLTDKGRQALQAAQELH